MIWTLLPPFSLEIAVPVQTWNNKRSKDAEFIEGYY